MEKKFLDESTLTYLRNYIDGQDKVIYNTAANLVSSTHLESLTRPATQPDAQVIPSITTTNEQQNLTIGDGLEIRDGALTTKKYVEANPTESGTTNLTSLKVNGEVFNIPEAPSNIVTTDTEQEISSKKTFTSNLWFKNSLGIAGYISSGSAHNFQQISIWSYGGYPSLSINTTNRNYNPRELLLEGMGGNSSRMIVYFSKDGNVAMLSDIPTIKDITQLYKHEYALTETSSSDIIKVCFWSTQNVKVALEDASRYAFSNIQAYDETTSKSLTLLRINSDSFYVIGDSGAIESKAYSVTSYTIDGTTTEY